MQFFPSDKRLREIFFSKSPTPPASPSRVKGSAPNRSERQARAVRACILRTMLLFWYVNYEYIRFSLHEHTPKRGDASATLKEAYFFQMPEFEQDN